MSDSITALGNSSKGYVQLVIAGFKEEGIQAAAIPAEHSGDTSGNVDGKYSEWFNMGWQ